LRPLACSAALAFLFEQDDARAGKTPFDFARDAEADDPAADNQRIRVVIIPALPHLPRRLAAVPHRGQELLFAVSIHALPEATVKIGYDLLLAGQAIERFLLEHARVIRQVVADFFVHHEKAAVDEASLLLGFSLNALTIVPRISRSPKRAGRVDGGDRQDFFCCLWNAMDLLMSLSVTPSP